MSPHRDDQLVVVILLLFCQCFKLTLNAHEPAFPTLQLLVLLTYLIGDVFIKLAFKFHKFVVVDSCMELHFFLKVTETLLEGVSESLRPLILLHSVLDLVGSPDVAPQSLRELRE